jgi:hypothetical protein
LYNLRDDISEEQDLSADQPGLTAALAETLAVWRQSVEAKIPPVNPDWQAGRRPFNPSFQNNGSTDEAQE